MNMSIGLGMGRGLGLSWASGLMPTLDLNFLNGTMPAAGLTFTRAGGGGRINSSGLYEWVGADVPRFDYDPITLACKGLLIEESRTNRIGWPGDFTQSAWVKIDTSPTPGLPGLGGTTSATKLVESATSGYHRAEYGATYTAGQMDQLTVVAKADGRSVLSLTLNSATAFSPNPPRVYFNLANGSVGTQQNGAVGSITPLGSGRYRCRAYATPTATGSGVVQIGIHAADNGLVYTGDGTSGILLENVNLQTGAFATSDIAAAGSPVTRAADVLTMTGTNFSRWFNPTEGTIVAEFSTITNGLSNTGGNAFPFIYDIDSAAAATSGHSLLASAGYGPGVRAQTQVAGVSQAELTSAVALGTGAIIRHAYTYKANRFAASLNGGAVLTDVLGSLPTPDRLSIGSQDAGGSNTASIHLRRLLYYPRGVDDGRVQQLAVAS